MRILKVAPIVHTQAETRIPYSPILRRKLKEYWKRAKPKIREAYDDWIKVQLFIDAFAIPKEFEDPRMTIKEYKKKWLERLLKIGSPLSETVNEILEKGATLESTEIEEKDFWLDYQKEMSGAMKSTPHKLDKINRRREEFISDRINSALNEKGIADRKKALGKVRFRCRHKGRTYMILDNSDLEKNGATRIFFGFTLTNLQKYEF